MVCSVCCSRLSYWSAPLVTGQMEPAVGRTPAWTALHRCMRVPCVQGPHRHHAAGAGGAQRRHGHLSHHICRWPRRLAAAPLAARRHCSKGAGSWEHHLGATGARLSSPFPDTMANLRVPSNAGCAGVPLDPAVSQMAQRVQGRCASGRLALWEVAGTARPRLCEGGMVCCCSSGALGGGRRQGCAPQP
jgi:hypothetical protein